MQNYSRLVVLPVFLLFLSANAGAQNGAEDFYRQWVDYRNGEISVDFEETPVRFALHAIQAKTGFQIVIPSPGEQRMVNLRLQRQPLEPAIRALISTIGYTSFALLYDASGRPSRALVLQTQPVAKPAEKVPEKETASAILSAEEHEKLQKDLARWQELKTEERNQIETRLKVLEPSEEREQLIKEYGKQLLGIAE